MKIEHLLRESDVEEARAGGALSTRAASNAAGKNIGKNIAAGQLKADTQAQIQQAKAATPSQTMTKPQGSFNNLPKTATTKPVTTPNAGSNAMGAMAGQLSGTGAPKANTMANTPTSKINTAKPGNSNAAATTQPEPDSGVDLSKSYSIGRGLKDLAVGTADTVAQVGGKLIGGTAKNIQQAWKGLPTGSYDYAAGKAAFGGDANRGTGVNISGAGGVSTPYVNKDKELKDLRARLARLEKLVAQP
jgi:hypothetical protein